MLVLTVLQGPDKGRRFELPANEPQMIGRSSESLPLKDQTISRRHAELTPDDGRWFLRDLKSSNGTFVNGVRVTDRRELKPGDQVRTGTTLLLFGDERDPSKSTIRVARKGEIDINVESTVASSEESMIMAVPDPSQAAEFQLRVIYELTALIGSVTDEHELLENVMNVIFEYFQADRGFILLQDNPNDELDPVVVRERQEGLNRTRKRGDITVSRTIVRYVLQKRVGVLSSNAMNDTRFARGDSVHDYGIRSAMCVPIRFRDKVYGVIQVDSKVANYTYTEDQLVLMTALGMQTGLALTNARLYAERLRDEKLAAVGQTVASLSHSIKNILQGMSGGGEVVDLGLRKNNMKVVRNGWDIVRRNLQRIYELAMNMLAYSKQRRPELEMTNLEQLFDEIVDLVQKQFDSKRVGLLADIAPDLPPVPLDPAGIHQAVLNLLTNALDAVEPETGVVTIRCEYDSNTERVQISVRDNGEGMRPGTMKRLFEPFHSTKGLRGTGLGLVVAKKVVEEHGGSISVDSSPGEGSTFTLSLPINVEAVPQSADTHGPSA